jgi:hypothetical protein
VGSLDFRRWPFPKYRQGGYYYMLIEGGDSSQTPVNGAEYATPFPLWQPDLMVAAIGIQVITAGESGSKIRLGIRADEDSQGYAPDLLIVDAGQIDGTDATTNTGRQEKTFSPPLRLTGPAMYWATLRVDSASTTQPTIKMTSGYTPGIASHFSDLVNLFTGGYKSEDIVLSGGLPAHFTSTIYSSTRTAKIYIKTA